MGVKRGAGAPRPDHRCVCGGRLGAPVTPFRKNFTRKTQGLANGTAISRRTGITVRGEMATQAQIEANRRNSLNSSGPRSMEGKAVSRFNALKTGIQAKAQVIPGEDAAELEQLAADYHRQYRPATPLERFLVDAIVTAEWQKRRLARVEGALWEHFVGEGQESLGAVYERNQRVFDRLHRQKEAAERSYHRALRQLQAEQKGREEAEESDSEGDTEGLGSFVQNTPAREEGRAEARSAEAPVPGRRDKPDHPALHL